MRGLHWFRADLRVTDNKALNQAILSSDELLAIFILTPKTWLEHDAAPIKIQFILNHLKLLSDTLIKQGIPLLIEEVDGFADCPKLLQAICQKHQIKQLYFNKQYEFDELHRDASVIKTLVRDKITVHAYDDQTVLSPDHIVSQQGHPLKVFTPFKKRWLVHASDLGAWKPVNRVSKTFSSDIQRTNKANNFTHSERLGFWPVGEKKAQERLYAFCETHLMQYHLERDYPSMAGTSQLSPYLAQGILSVRQCIAAMMDYLNVNYFLEILNFPGPATWLSELIWRDFYKYIMYHYPDVCRHKPMRKETERLHWRYDAAQFDAWCNGLTGFPLVDAAMRQLKEMGWMHNRLRMVVAMFFSKLLFFDWRLGERYFMQNLIDGDLAANNGGWQWCASTGTDAVPYFRVFNPMLQSKRYDPDATFIQHYCPELASLDPRIVHDPYQHAESFRKLNYPEPIIDYPIMRKEVIAAFKRLHS